MALIQPERGNVQLLHIPTNPSAPENRKRDMLRKQLALPSNYLFDYKEPSGLVKDVQRDIKKHVKTVALNFDVTAPPSLLLPSKKGTSAHIEMKEKYKRNFFE